MALIDISECEIMTSALRLALSLPPTESDRDTRFQKAYPVHQSAVVKVNRELKHCVKLAREGLPSEAAQRADEERLLEIATVLDLSNAEYDQCRERAEHLGLDQLVMVDNESAVAINELFEPQSRLSTTMKRLRRLALARAPLDSRLKVMRLMQRAQPDNPLITEDIKLFEKLRCEELMGELKSAAKEGQRSAVHSLMLELTSDAWLVLPPKQVVEHARQTDRELQRRDARARVSELNSALHDAWLAKDIDLGIKLLQRWDKSWRLAELSEENGLFSASYDSRLWAEEHVARNSAHADFLASLDSVDVLFENLNWRQRWKPHRMELERVQQQLDRAVGRLQDLAADVPDEHANRFDLACRQLSDRWTSISSIERRRRQQLIGGIALAVTLLVVGSFHRAGALSRQRKMDDTVAAVESRVDHPDIEGTNQFIATLSDEALANPRIKELISRIEKNRQNVDEQRKRFQQSHGALMADLPQTATLEEMNRIEGRIRELNQSASEESQKSLSEDLNRLAEERRRELQRDVDAEFSNTLAEIRKSIDEVRQGEVVALETCLQKLSILRKQKDASEEVRRMAELLYTATGERHTEWLNEREEKRILSSLRSTVGDWSRFRETVQKYIDQAPKKSRSEEFRKLLRDDVALWSSIDPWNRMLIEIDNTDFFTTSPRQARDMATRLTKLRDDYPFHPAAKSVAELSTRLDALSNREDANGQKIESPLLEMAKNPTLKRMYMILTEDKKRFYSDEEPLRQGNFIIIRNFKSSDMSDTKKSQIKFSQVSPLTDGPKSWISPQFLFTDMMRKTIEELKTDNWESEFMRLLNELHHNKVMDPLVKFMLIQQIVPVIERGSTPARIALAKYSKHVQRAEFETAHDTIDPDNSAARKSRNDAEQWFQDAPDLEAITKQMELTLKERTQPAPQSIHIWVGYLILDDSEQWISVVPSMPPDYSGALQIAISGNDQSMLFENVGTVNMARAALSPKPGTNWVQGRPLFVEQMPTRGVNK